jgi:hypothetical protein
VPQRVVPADQHQRQQPVHNLQATAMKGRGGVLIASGSTATTWMSRASQKSSAEVRCAYCYPISRPRQRTRTAQHRGW